jgi:flagellar FliL protein
MAEDKKKDEAEVKPKKGKKTVLIIALAVLLLAGGGGAAWYFLKPKAELSAEEEMAKKKAADKAKIRTFVSLDPFTVNLADEGGDRMIQVAMVLEVTDTKVGTDLSAQMPAVRNSILLLLSAKQSRELLSVSGKGKLAAEIALSAGKAIGWEPTDPDAEEKPRKTSVKAKAKAAEDEEEADPKDPPAKKAAEPDPDEEEAEPKKPVKKGSQKKKKPPADPNPIEAVHFSQFIIQ